MKKTIIKSIIIAGVLISCLVGVKYSSDYIENQNKKEQTEQIVEPKKTKKIKDSIKETPTPTSTPTPTPVVTEPEPTPEPVIVEEVPIEEPVAEEYYEDETIYEEAPSTENNSGMSYYGTCTITFYCSCPQCCGQWSGSGGTASGASPTAGWTVANGSLPFGTMVYIEGLGTYCVEDRGVGGDWFDIYVNDHNEIPGWGMGTFDVYVLN